jgi:linoleoyl-CoA desaturase
MPRFQPQSAFAKDVKARGQAMLASQSSGRYADKRQWLRALFTAFALGAAYWLLLSSGFWQIRILLSAACGVLTYVLVAGLCHDASHGSLSRRAVVNRFVVFSGFALLGVSGALWARRHVRVHHMFPNVAGTDIDADGSALIRLSPHKPWHRWHRFQVYYALPLYALVLPHLAFVEDFSHLAKARREAPHLFGPLAVMEFALTKALHVLWALIVPYMVLQPSLGALLLGYLIATGSASALFVIINVGSHISDEAEFLAPSATGMIDHDWATHQLLTSIDWSPQSPLAVGLTGGANAHTAHHLFPEAAHCHNTQLSEIVSECARVHDLPRNILSFNGMLAAHLRHLRKMSAPIGSVSKSGEREALPTQQAL